MTRSNPCIFDDKSVTDDAEKRRIDNETGTGKINEVRLWWNGIHNGLKIRRRKLEGSNPSSRTKGDALQFFFQSDSIYMVLNRSLFAI